MIRAGLFFLSIAPLALGCEYIAADRITGAYLAKSVPEFGQIPSDAVLAYAPGPGSKRVFRPDELNRIAARFGIPSKVSNAACFEWELHPVSEEQLLVAMRKTFDAPGLKLEIVRHSRTPAPVGEIVFPKSGLAATSFSDPGTSLFWRGSVIYAGGKKFDLWAQVRISAAMPRVIAVRTIAPGLLLWSIFLWQRHRRNRSKTRPIGI